MKSHKDKNDIATGENIMQSNLTNKKDLKTPEDIELDQKRQKLVQLEDALSQKELELTTLRRALIVFERQYLKIIGARYAELDEIEAQIAEAIAAKDPEDKSAHNKATNAREKAKETVNNLGNEYLIDEALISFKPSESLKKLYREVAKCIHPDLVTDEKERTRRQHLMADANRAYGEGDETKLRAILEEWASSPESVKGEGTAVELVRVIRKIAAAKRRLRDIQTETAQLEESDLLRLKTNVETAENQGRDLLSEMASRIDEKIDLANKNLAEILRSVNP